MAKNMQKFFCRGFNSCMNIDFKNIISFNGVKEKKENNVNSFKTKPMPNDSFTKSNEFDINGAMYSLKNIKNEKNKPKLNDYYLQVIRSELEQTPEKFSAISSMAKNPKINGEFVYILASQPLDKLNELKEFSEVKNDKGEPKYDGKALMNFNDKANYEDLAKVKPLTKTSLSAKNIVALSQEKNLPDVEKLSDKILELEKAQQGKLENISVSKDNYKNGEMIITAKNNDNTTVSKAYDKDFNLLYEEQSFEDTENKILKTISKDYRNNTVSETTSRIDDYVGRPVVIEETRTVNDKNGKLIRTEHIKPSEVIGVLNVEHIDADGNVSKISQGYIEPKSGHTVVIRDMESSDGTKTHCQFENDPQGNKISDYQITDKDGNVLYKNSEAFEVLTPNRFISSKNDEKYEINVSDSEINVHDINNPERTASFKIDKELQGDFKMLLATLKELPGSELIKLRENVDTLKSIPESLDSFYSGPSRTINTGDNAYLLMHEIGHSVDFKNTVSTSEELYQASLVNTITKNPEVNEIYNKERQAFLDNFPKAQRTHIDYFINNENHTGGENGAIGETIAETNALINTPKTVEALQYRSQYLQQYFPQTLAAIANLLK